METQVIPDSTPYQVWFICRIWDSHRVTYKDLLSSGIWYTGINILDRPPQAPGIWGCVDWYTGTDILERPPPAPGIWGCVDWYTGTNILDRPSPAPAIRGCVDWYTATYGLHVHADMYITPYMASYPKDGDLQLIWFLAHKLWKIYIITHLLPNCRIIEE